MPPAKKAKGPGTSPGQTPVPMTSRGDSDAWEKGLRDYAKAHGKPIPAAVAPEPEPPKAEEPKAEPPKAEEPSKPLPWYKASPP